METVNSQSVEKLFSQLRRNNFLPYFVEDLKSAKDLFFNELLPEINPKSISYADSITLKKTQILEDVRDLSNIRFIDTFDKTLSWEEVIERRRQALLVDLFLTGTNAITEDGELVNLDMIGNRINGIVFGPRNVVLTIGVNKIVKDLVEAKRRVKEISAIQNAMRHESFNLPCTKKGYCLDCSNEKRICNVWSIIERCYPKNRIRIIFINKELGL